MVLLATKPGRYISRTMTKAVSILLVIVVGMVLGGCDGSQVRPQTDADTIKNSRQGYEALFTVGALHDIEIVISTEEWLGLIRDMADYARDDTGGRPMTGSYRSATFVYRGPAGDAIIGEVGFRTKGHVNRPYPQDPKVLALPDLHDLFDLHRAHFKIKFNEVFEQEEETPEWEDRNQRRFAKLRELELRMNSHNIPANGDWNESQIQEIYSYELMRRAGVNACRVGSARLWITIGEEKHYFGVYALIEPVDKSFLTKRYGSGANDGNLYKCLWGNSGPANLGPIDDPDNFEHPLASNPNIVGVKDWQDHYRPTYDLKTNTEQPDHTVLLDFISNLNTLNGEELKEYLDTNFEVDRFLRYLAVNVLLGRWDDYWSIGNNYYLYFNNDGKIEHYPVDFDMALGEGWSLFDVANASVYSWGNRDRELLEIIYPNMSQEKVEEYAADIDYPLVEKILEIDEYRQTYEHYLAEFMKPANKLFTFSEYESTFKRLYTLYSPHLDNEMDEGEEMYISNNIRMYFRNRTLSIIEELGLNEADYDVPDDIDDGGGEVLPAFTHTGELSFTATEYTHHEPGFSLQHPASWTDSTKTELYEAISPSRTTGLFVSSWTSRASSLVGAVIATLREGPVRIIASGETTLADGAPAEIVEYTAILGGTEVHCYSIGLLTGSRWLTVNLWNIDQYSRFDRRLLEEIAHTLRLN